MRYDYNCPFIVIKSLSQSTSAESLVLPTPSCPQKANTDIASKTWPCRCFSDVFTYVKMSGGDKYSKVESVTPKALAESSRI